jgi:hypothetical protein
MKTIFLPGPDRELFVAKDPDGFLEVEFEALVLRALAGIYRDYRCIVFGGSFQWESVIKRPDLALVARDFSHWFVLEVELLTHSLEKHVLPQLRTLRYGEPCIECIGILARELGIDRGQAETLLRRVPYGVAVIANGVDPIWDTSLKAIRTQLLTLHVYADKYGAEAFELSGALSIMRRSLAFGMYYANSGLIKLPRDTQIATGEIQIEDENGAISSWFAIKDDRNIWIEKSKGKPNIPDAHYVQLLQTIDNRIVIRIG